MDDASQTRTALAALFSALVKALEERNAGVEAAFVRHLDEALVRLGESGGDAPHVRNTLAWTKEMLAAETDPAEPAWIVYPPLADRDPAASPSNGRVRMETFAKAVQFWTRLPPSDRHAASVETASGRRYDAAHLGRLSALFRDGRS